MPYLIKRLPTGKYQVSVKSTGQILAKGTTKAKAEKQVKAIELIKNKKKSK